MRVSVALGRSENRHWQGNAIPSPTMHDVCDALPRARNRGSVSRGLATASYAAAADDSLGELKCVDAGSVAVVSTVRSKARAPR